MTRPLRGRSQMRGWACAEGLASGGPVCASSLIWGFPQSSAQVWPKLLLRTYRDGRKFCMDPHSPCHLPQEGSLSIKTGCLQTLRMELSFGKIAAFPFCLGCWEALNQSWEHISGST